VYSKFSRELGLYVQLEVLGDGCERGPSRVLLPRTAQVRIIPTWLESWSTSPHGPRRPDGYSLHLEVGTVRAERSFDFLRHHSAGQTVTYGRIARRLGRPGASRAVGTRVRATRRHCHPVPQGRPEVRRPR